MLPPIAEIMIDGDKLPAKNVQEIFLELKKDHIEAVVENIRKIDYPIKHVKTYIRTALYNAVLETGTKMQIEANGMM